MHVLIVIVSFNSGTSLMRCVEAARRQTFEQREIVVVDNASSNSQTLAMLDTLDASTDVTVCRMSTNLGYGGAINAAVSEFTNSTYIACLNADAFPEPSWLSHLVAMAESDATIASVAPLMRMANDPSMLDGAGDCISISGYAWRLGHGKSLARWRAKTQPVFSACAGACLYRRTAFNEVDGFDESFFMYVEDVDLGFRLRLAGYTCWLCCEAEVLHVGSESTGARSDFTVFYGHRNTELMLLKCLPLALFIPVGVVHGMIMLALCLPMVMRGQLGVYGRAKWAALKHGGRAISARKTVKRRVSTIALLKLFTWRLLP